jgi:hypothetical protein
MIGRLVGASVMAPFLISAAACATVARHTTQDFTVETDPPGAHVQLSTGQSCEATPCTFHKIKREAQFTVTASHDGYVTQTVNVTHRTSPAGAAAMAATIALPGGLAMALVDANFGATQDLTPNPARATLPAAAQH